MSCHHSLSEYFCGNSDLEKKDLRVLKKTMDTKFHDDAKPKIEHTATFMIFFSNNQIDSRILDVFSAKFNLIIVKRSSLCCCYSL